MVNNWVFFEVLLRYIIGMYSRFTLSNNNKRARAMACPLDLFISSSSSSKVTGTLSFPFLCVSSLPFRRTSFGVVWCARLFVFALGVVERRPR